MKTKAIFNIRSIAVVAIIFLFVLSAFQPTLFAATTARIVDSGTIGGDYPDQVALVTSYPGTINNVQVQLDARESWVKLAFDTNTAASFTIYNGCFGTDYDFPRDGYCHRSGTMSSFRTYRSDANGNLTNTQCGSTISSTSVNGNGVYILKSGWSDPISVSSCLVQNNRTGWYEVFVKSTLNGIGINGYKIQAMTSSGNNAYAGYADSPSTNSGYPTAIMSRVLPSNDPNNNAADDSDGVQNDISINMRRTCDSGAVQKLNLKWDDADHSGAGGSPPDANVYFTITHTTEAGVVKTYDSRNIYDDLGFASNAALIGGDGDVRNITFNTGAANININTGDKVVWKWHNIRRINGIQVYVKYDNNFYYSQRDCNPVAGRYTISVPSTEHEKGSGNKNIVGTITMGKNPCNDLIADGQIVTQINWKITAPNGTQASTVTNVPNCTGALQNNTVTLPVSGAYLDGRPVGYNGDYVASVTSVSGSGAYSGTTIGDPGKVLVYSVPFSRFFGNDVVVCDTAELNRFAFDNRSVANAKNGSFSEYASFFTESNQVDISNTTNFSALNTAAPFASGFPGLLDSNYNFSCGSGIVIEDINGAKNKFVLANGSELSGEFTDKRTYYVDGDVLIKDNLTTVASGAFDPNTYPVIVIYATGSIHIDPSVTAIDAILIAQNSINTCNGVVDEDQLDTLCAKPLKITGAIAADTVRLQRTAGTRYVADAPTTRSVTDGSINTAAEIIEFPWYLHYVGLDLTDYSTTKFNAYTQLPPRL